MNSDHTINTKRKPTNLHCLQYPILLQYSMPACTRTVVCKNDPLKPTEQSRTDSR